MSWGYSENDGPDTWIRDFPHAGLASQSPIDISSSQAEYNPDLKPIVTKYDNDDITEVIRTVHGVQWNASRQTSTLTGGPLGSRLYKLVQFHYHWSDSDCDGAEHQIDGKCYAAELHLVYYNASQYATFADAVAQKDGLAVLGILIKAGDANDEGFQKLGKYLLDVTYKDQVAHINETFDPSTLLPENTSDYWTYSGSLTTPPCYESVRWIVFKEPVTYARKQLDLFRSLHDVSTPSGDSGGNQGIRLLKNNRPPQPLNGRTVYKSFE